MRKYLRKPPEVKVASSVQWSRLYDEALKRAEATEDVRVKDLRHFSSDKESALRRLSIITEVDLDREFPS